MPSISVIICTYNPDPEIFAKCLESLSKAIRVYAPLEVILVDNNSNVGIVALDCVRTFLEEHRQARIIAEPVAGLTHARLRGIKESSGEILIYVDDDNFLADDYLEKAAKIGATYPFIGAFSGQVELNYTQEPPTWTKRYWGMLVHRLFKGNYWGNLPFNNDFMPNGAGLCVRREVAREYLSLHEKGRRNFTLDRKKDSLISGGDNDLAMTACDIGLGMGLFEALYLRHFIPQSRFTLEYLTKLTYGIYFSSVILKYMRTGTIDPVSKKRGLYNKVSVLFLSKEDAAINKALQKGVNDAKNWINDLNVSNSK